MQPDQTWLQSACEKNLEMTDILTEEKRRVDWSAANLEWLIAWKRTVLYNNGVELVLISVVVNNTGNARKTLILRRVHETIVAVEKQ